LNDNKTIEKILLEKKELSGKKSKKKPDRAVYLAIINFFRIERPLTIVNAFLNQVR
jgi:hypothetical protein